MKKLILILFLLTSMLIEAQIRFIDNEYFTFSIGLDPSATVKEKSVNLYGEVCLVSYWKYVNVNTQFLPSLKGGYWDFGGTFGVNLTSGTFEKTRYYTGLRLGLIKRGFNDTETFTYPLFGAELGVDYYITDEIFVGVRGTGDYRTDFKYSYADPFVRYSGFVKLGIKF